MMSKNSVKTLADIARQAGVATSTVSRALNDSPLIGEETKERIRTIAREHDYQINASARQLRMKQSRTIAFVTHAYHKEFSVADLFGLEIMGGISSGLNANGYDMLVIHVDPGDTQWAHEYLDTGRVDGFILLTSTRKQYHIQTLLDMGAPFIVWGIPRPGQAYPSVCGDNLNGGKLAARHLLHSGRQRVAFLGGPAEELEVQQRLQGYKTAHTKAGKKANPALFAYGDFSNTSGAAAMEELLERDPKLDAVFVNSDLMAIAAMDVLRAHGRRVPADVAVVGYDDLSIAAYSNPPLTTIRQNIPMAGKLLAQNLVQYLQTGLVKNETIPVELVVRQSA